MNMRLLLATILAAAAVAGCGEGGCEPGAGFSRNLGGTGGATTLDAALAAAAAENAANYPFEVPDEGWFLDGVGRRQTARSDAVELTLLRLDDDTWAVEAGRCIGG